LLEITNKIIVNEAKNTGKTEGKRASELELSWAFFWNLNITLQVQAPKSLNLNTGTFRLFEKFELVLALVSALLVKLNWNSELGTCQYATQISKRGAISAIV